MTADVSRDAAAVDQPRRPAIVLDSYAARSCAVKTQNRFDPTVVMLTADSSIPLGDALASAMSDGAAASGPGDESLREIFAGGAEHRQAVGDQLANAVNGTIDLRQLTDAAERLRQTAAAVAAGAELILGPAVPNDVAGHRSGRPDGLIRGPNRGDGRPGYFPVLTRFGKLLENLRQSKRSEASSGAVIRISPLTDPLFSCSTGHPELSFRTRQHNTLLRAGHYWRSLQAAGWSASGGDRAALVGTDDRGVVWIDLAQPFIRTYSATSSTGWRFRTVLERYDHEHDFRVEVAQRAQQRTGASSDPEPLVRPIRVSECDHCEWWQTCRERLDDDDLSIRIERSPLDVREISALRSLGVETIHDLANSDLDSLSAKYLPLVTHRPGGESRLKLTARRSRLLARGVELERVTQGPIPVPEADLEIDFDIETARSGQVYLWGFRVHDRAAGTEPTFVEFSAWSELDGAAEHDLAVRAMTWLRQQASAQDTVTVYHYSDYELTQLRRLAESGHPDLLWALDFAKGGFCDLYRVVADHYFGAHGLGLKTVATKGAGFSWRDSDPGGLASLSWFDTAVHALDPAERDAARNRVLAYNEDDVAATWHLRRWLREQG